MIRALVNRIKLQCLFTVICCVFYTSSGVPLFLPSTNATVNAELSATIAELSARMRKAPEAEVLAYCDQLIQRWEGREAHAQAALAANLSHYIGSRADFGGTQRPSSRVLAWKALERAESLAWWQEAKILELLKSAAYPDRYSRLEVSPVDARTEITGRWLKLLEMAEATALEVEVVVPASSAIISVSLDATVPKQRVRKTVSTPDELAENERLWLESEALLRKQAAELPLKTAAHSARQASDSLNERVASFLTDIHTYSGSADQIAEVIHLSKSVVGDEKMRNLVLDRLEKKLPDSLRVPLAGARKVHNMGQPRVEDALVGSVNTTGKRLPLAVRVRLAASVPAARPTNSQSAKAFQPPSNLAAVQVSPSKPVVWRFGGRSALLILLAVSSGLVILAVLKRARARGASGGTK